MDRSLSTFIAKKLTSKYNQHVTSMTVGKTGSGKSFANLALCEGVAQKIAATLGGEPEDYFSIDNVAIITKEEVKRVVKSFKKHNIYLMDDIGVGWNARTFKDSVNIILNDLFQTFRLQNNFLAVTLPDAFLIDKVPRSLTHYLIEMEQAHFDRGFTIGKVFAVIRKPRTGETHHQYFYDHGKFVRHRFGLPSPELVKAYNERREEQYQSLFESRMAKWDELEAKEIAKATPRERKADKLPLIEAAIESGHSVTESCKKHGMTVRYFNMLKNGAV